jgi:hypothetical protein
MTFMVECGTVHCVPFMLVLNLLHLLCREELVSRLDKLKVLRDVNFGYTHDNHVCICNCKYKYICKTNGWDS